MIDFVIIITVSMTMTTSRNINLNGCYLQSQKYPPGSTSRRSISPALENTAI